MNTRFGKGMEFFFLEPRTALAEICLQRLFDKFCITTQPSLLSLILKIYSFLKQWNELKISSKHDQLFVFKLKMYNVTKDPRRMKTTQK